MKLSQKSFLFTFVIVLLLVEASTLVAQERYTVLVGKVLGIRARLWLDVQSEKDRAIANFRIGHNTIYVPHRYPFVGERVKVEYLIQRGSPAAYRVTILNPK